MTNSSFMKEQITNSDIQKVIREMVIESEQKYRLLVENSLVGILIYCDDHIIYANSRFKEMFGYTDGEFKTFQIWQFIHPDCREMVKSRAYRRINGEEPESEYEIKAMKKDGTVVDVMLKSVRMNYLGKPSLLVNLVDITELKKAQKEINELSTIVQTAIIPIIKIDPMGQILYMNKSAEKIFGNGMEYFKGRFLSDLLFGIDPDEMQNHIINQTKKVGFDAKVLCKDMDGAPLKLRLLTCPLTDDTKVMSAIACFMIDPAVQDTEQYPTNVDYLFNESLGKS